MIYYGDSENLTEFHCSCFVGEDQSEILIRTPQELKKFFSSLRKDDTIVTANGVGYDFIIWSYMINKQDATTKDLRKLSDEIILEGKHRIGAVKHYQILREKYKFRHVDIMELMNLKGSLKRSAAAFGYPNVKESSVDLSTKRKLTQEEEREIIEYCFSDCKSLQFLFNRDDVQVEMKSRDMFKDIFDVDVFGLGRPRAVNYIMHEMCYKKTGRSLWDLRNAFYRAPKNKFHFGKILVQIGNNSALKFDDDSPELVSFRECLLKYERPIHAQSWKAAEIKKIHYYDDGKGPLKSVEDQFKGLESHKLDIRVPINGKIYRFKEGGIHGEEKDEVYHTNSTHELFDIDFTAFYPLTKMKYDAFCKYPDSSGFSLKEFYSNIVDKNLELKSDKTKKDQRMVFKIASNLYYGFHQDKTNAAYDPRLQLKICLTGQLILLRLIEQFEKSGIEVIYANTDGIAVYCHRGKKDTLNKLCKRFANNTSIPIEPVSVQSMYISDTNNYVWLMLGGYAKTKGKFNNYISWMNPTIKFPIVQIAIERYLSKGVAIEKTIRDSQEPLSFCAVVSASGMKKFNFTTKQDLKTNDLTLINPTTKRKIKRNSYKLKCKELVGNMDSSDQEASIKLKLELSKYDDSLVIFPNALRFYISNDGHPLYNLTFKSESERSTGQIRTHPLAESAKLMLDLPDELPSDINYQAYIDLANQYIGNWKPNYNEVLSDDLPF